MSDVWPRKTTVVQHGTMAAERRATKMASPAVSHPTVAGTCLHLSKPLDSSSSIVIVRGQYNYHKY